MRALGLIAVACASLALTCVPVPPRFDTTLRADDPLVGKVYDVRARAFIHSNEVIHRAASADFVLLGEKHDNPDHHRLQAWLIDQIALQRRQPAVVFEMIRVDRAEALRDAPRDPDAIATAVDWPHSGWPDFALYEPVFEAALAGGMPLAAGDLARDQLAPLRKNGLAALSPDERARLALDPGPSASQREALAAQVRDAHCGMVPDAMIEPMIDIQRARDAALADAMLGAATRHGAVLIAGGGHASRDGAVPLYLERRAPQRVVFALAFVEAPRDAEGAGEDLAQRAAALGEGFDVIWVTPRVDDEDPCSRFRHDLERMRKPGPGGSMSP